MANDKMSAIAQSPNGMIQGASEFPHSGFVIVSDFGPRHSSFPSNA